MTCKEKLTSNAVPCMPPFSVGETNPLQCLSMFDWHASVQHQAHLWPVAFGELCQKLLQHICCFHKSFLFSSQSNHKVLVLLVDDLQFCMASLTYAMNVGLFGAKKFQLESMLLFHRIQTDLRRFRGGGDESGVGEGIVDVSIFKACTAAIAAFFLASSAVLPAIGSKCLSPTSSSASQENSVSRTWYESRQGPSSRGNRLSLRCGCRSKTIGFLARKQLKWLLTVWAYWDVYGKTKEGPKHPKTSEKNTANPTWVSWSSHFLKCCRSTLGNFLTCKREITGHQRDWEMTMQTRHSFAAFKNISIARYGVKLKFDVVPYWAIEIFIFAWSRLRCVSPSNSQLAPTSACTLIVSLHRHKRKRWCIARFKAKNKQISLATKGFECHPEVSSEQWTATTAGMG